MLLAAGLNLISPQKFGTWFKSANDWLLSHFGWLFVACAFASFAVCVWVCFSPLGRVRLGGRDAQPLMSRWNWFAITLCTTIAVGILFWSTAEPLHHYARPPQSLGLAASSPESARFALAALYLHWTFVPYSIYCAASLVFAFAHYNMRLPFSLGSTLVPVLGQRTALGAGQFVDAICLFSLVAGMAASLGTGILTIAGGLQDVLRVPSVPWVWALIAMSIVATFVVSSVTGLMKGIRILSDVNAKGLLLLGLVVFLVGPTLPILYQGLSSAGEFAMRFLQIGLQTSLVSRDPWAKEWSIFYWAVWIAWTPVTACFLGRIAYGRTVREFMAINFVFPSLFSMAWMAVFGVTALQLEMNGAGLVEKPFESISYAVLRSLPLGVVMVLFYLLSAFVCFVTSADSNTTAMAGISSQGVSLENPEGSLTLKVAWGLLVGATAWTMITFANVDGIKYLSNLGGFPAAILLLFILGSLVVIQVKHPTLNIVDSASSK
jgi:glycine betaine transporter